ncbi:MAG TPA: Trm112 family protein [Terriglobales bacterium]|nr:Trm112 family protein [Terriglobales bacterium]
MLDRDLLNILACPACKTPITYDEERSVLKCGNCHRVYPVRDGIPILLVDEAIVEA